MRSFSDVVKQGSEDRITTTKLKAVARDVVQSDNRKRAVMLFGLEEAANEEVRREVDELLGAACLVGKPAISDCYRFGAAKQGATRPMKVLFQNSDAAASVLRSDECNNTAGFSLQQGVQCTSSLTPADRTRQEREERRTQVTVMKENISREPQRYHYIRDGVLCSTEKVSSSSPAASTTNSSRPATSSTCVPVNLLQVDSRNKV